VRIGIVGRGFGARVVAPVFAETEGCEVVDVVSARDDAAVRELCARPDLDLVAVHSPPFLHPEHVGYALDAGRPVLCDKPFGRNAHDAAAMLDHARAAGVVHLGNLEFRYQPGRVALRELANSGAVGTVEHVEVSQCSAGSRVPLRNYGWLFDADRGGGWIGFDAHDPRQGAEQLRSHRGVVHEGVARRRKFLDVMLNAEAVEGLIQLGGSSGQGAVLAAVIGNHRTRALEGVMQVPRELAVVHGRGVKTIVCGE